MQNTHIEVAHFGFISNYYPVQKLQLILNACWNEILYLETFGFNT